MKKSRLPEGREQGTVNNRRSLLAVVCYLLLSACLLTAVGCELFAGKIDDDFLGKIDEEIRVANAEVIDVKVLAVDSGVTQGAPPEIKLAVPFNLKFTPFANSSFLRWTAYYNGAEPGNGQVVFSDPLSVDTTVTVNIDPAGETLWIIPLAEADISGGMDVGVFPEPSLTYGFAHQDHYIIVKLPRPIAPESLRYGDRYFRGEYDDEWDEGGRSPTNNPYTRSGSYDPQGVFTANFNNVIITGAVNQPTGYRGFKLENFYYPPLLSADGNFMYIWSRTGGVGENNSYIPAFQVFSSTPSTNELWDIPNPTITVSIPGTLKDAAGFPLGVSKTFSYKMMGNGGTHGEQPSMKVRPDWSYEDINVTPRIVDYFPMRAAFDNLCVISADDVGGQIDLTKLVNCVWNVDYDAQKILYPTDPKNEIKVPVNKNNSVYLMFQATNTRWRVTGARILAQSGISGGAGSGSYNYVTDVPLLGDVSGNVSASIEDVILKEKLVKAYVQKMRAIGDTSVFMEELPVYVVKYDLQNHSAAGTKKILVYARVPVELAVEKVALFVTSSDDIWGNKTLQLNHGQGMPFNLLYVRYDNE